MVALRGTNTSLNTLSHACVSHGNQPQHSAIDVAQSLQTSLNMPQSAVAQHINANQINLQPLNNVSLQFIPQQTNTSSLKHEQSSSRYSNSNCMLPSHHYRLLTQARAECYLPSAATGAAYMSNTAGGSQASAQTALRVQPTPQPSAPPAPQQDMSKTTMAGHNYVPLQNQTPQARPSYNIPQFRPSHHGTRPSTHPRQQQPYMPNTAATATAPVVYSHVMFHPAHMSIPPSYQQTRSQSYYSPAYMTPYINYNTPTSHTPSYYFASNSQQLPTPNLQANAAGGRSNPNTLVGPQSTLANPTAPTASLPPQQPHLHQTMTGTRPPHTKRHSHRIPIIDPKTQHDIFSDILSNDSQYMGGDTSERQTPQPDTTPSVAEEFTRMVNEVANQPTESALKASYVSKNVDLPVSSSSSSIQPQSNAINTNNNSVIKPEILNINENKTLGPDIAVESNETPVVSAISDSPVIVPKMPMNIKQLQKNSDQNVQPLVLDANKNLASNKQHKQNKKPVVPQTDENEKFSDNVSNVVSHGCPTTVTPASTVATTTTVSIAPAPVVTQTPTSVPITTSQPQRIREPRERVKSEEKEKDKNKEKEVQQGKDTPPMSSKSNGSTSSVAISSLDSLTEVINASTSQSSKLTSAESAKKQTAPKQSSQNLESTISCEANIEVLNKSELASASVPTATELLSASIEKLAKDLPVDPDAIAENKEASSAIQAQAKLTQSIASCIRTNQTEAKMKDINLNNKTTDADSANGNATEIKSENVKEDVNKNEKVVKNTKNTNKKSTNKMASNDLNVKDVESHENGKDETDKVNNVEQVKTASKKEEVATKSIPIEKPEVASQPVFTPKYKYSENQWSPINKSGKKCYDIELLKQIKDDPLSKDKPNIRLLEQCNVIRTTPMQELLSFPTMSRPINDSLMPTFAKSTGSRNNAPRDAKKDGRNIAPSGRGSVKLTQSPSGSSPHKPVIHVSLSLREDVKLNETENAWKPSRFKKDTIGEEDFKTQELYKKFRGILNKLTPQKFDTLLDKVKTLEINNQKRLEGVIDLIFEKAIDEPNFSEAYAKMCNKISTLKVPADNATSPDQCVNFRALIISKCQNQFETNKVDEQVLKLEKEISESMDPAKKKELQLLLEEENRRVRMRSVGNVRFIGELYKLKMLTSKIMVYCMTYLIDKLEEEKLECLCKLLTTIGEQVESEVKEQLDNVFKKMQEIVDHRKSNKISSRVRFMIQDVIELRKRKWQFKSVVDSQPKKMDEIQKEAEQQHRNIEILNSIPMGGYRRDEGGRGKRGEGRRQNSNSFMDSSSWKSSPRTNYTVDTSKLKAVTQKNINTIKLAPHNSGWNHGSGMKNTTQTGSNSVASLTKNMYSVLDTVTADPTSLKGSKDITPNYSKGASIERSTFVSRSDFSSGTGSRSGSMGVARSNSSSRGASAAAPAPPAQNNEPTPPPAPVAQKPLTEKEQKSIKSIIDLYLINPDDNEFVADIKQSFQPQYHAAVINEILNVAIEKSAKEIGMISKILLQLVSTNTISAEHFVLGISEIFANAPDLYIDIPMLNEYLAKIITPQIEKKHVTFAQLVKLCENNIISSKQGPLFLEAVIRDLKNSMGPSFVKSKWQESGVQLKDWMSEDKVSKWIEDNKFEFLEGNSKVAGEEVKKILTPAETQSKLLQLMNSDENYDCIKGWVQDNLGKSSNEDWFMRALIQAICEHALFGPEGRDVPHFSRDRMNKYSGLINDFGETRQAREASCLFGIQQLVHRLEHPQGLTLEIFQNLHEQYIINAEGFIAWEESEMEPEGKGVMMKALTSFFTNIKEVDNDDSCSED